MAVILINLILPPVVLLGILHVKLLKIRIYTFYKLLLLILIFCLTLFSQSEDLNFMLFCKGFLPKLRASTGKIANLVPGLKVDHVTNIEYFLIYYLVRFQVT